MQVPPSPQPSIRLEDLVSICDAVADDFAAIANTLNTAPVTLGAVAKECRQVVDSLRYLKATGHVYCQTPMLGVPLVQSSLDEAIRSIKVDILSLRSALGRLQRPVVDTSSTPIQGQLTIIWNEDQLRETLHRLKDDHGTLSHLLLYPGV
jgi:hypothetical protein